MRTRAEVLQVVDDPTWAEKVRSEINTLLWALGEATYEDLHALVVEEKNKRLGQIKMSDTTEQKVRHDIANARMAECVAWFKADRFPWPDSAVAALVQFQYDDGTVMELNIRRTISSDEL